MLLLWFLELIYIKEFEKIIYNADNKYHGYLSQPR